MSLLAAAAVGVGLSCIGALGQEQGNFVIVPVYEDPQLFHAPPGPWGLAAADVAGISVGQDLDGFPDLAIAGANSGQVWVLLNQGVDEETGNWLGLPDAQDAIVLDLTDLNPSAEPVHVAFGRLFSQTAPSVPDLVVTSPCTREVYVYENNAQNPGEFSFNARYEMPFGFEPRGVAIADFFGDGLPDIAVASQSSPEIAILRNDPNDPGKFPDTLWSIILLDPDDPCMAAWDLTVGNFADASALPDIVTSNRSVRSNPCTFLPEGNGDPCFAVDSITLVRNLGNGQFDPVGLTHACDPLEINWQSGAVVSGNFGSNHHGDDVALLGPLSSLDASASVFIIHGDGTGSFAFDCADDRYGSGETLRSAFDIAVGNLNGGAWLDLAFVLPGAPGTSNVDYVAVILGKGNGTFQTPCDMNPSEDCAYIYSVRPSGQPAEGRDAVQVLIVDLNQNGFGDIITSNRKNSDISVLINSLTVGP